MMAKASIGWRVEVCTDEQVKQVSSNRGYEAESNWLKQHFIKTKHFITKVSSKGRKQRLDKKCLYTQIMNK